MVLAVTVIVDFLWFGVLMSGFYKDEIGHLFAKNPNILPALVFYPMYVAGLFFFAVMPALRSGMKRRAAFLGAMLGLLAYGTYDLTNMATLRDWSLTMTVVDMLWGTVLSSVVSLLGYILVRRFAKRASQPVSASVV